MSFPEFMLLLSHQTLPGTAPVRTKAKEEQRSVLENQVSKSDSKARVKVPKYSLISAFRQSEWYTFSAGPSLFFGQGKNHPSTRDFKLHMQQQKERKAAHWHLSAAPKNDLGTVVTEGRRHATVPPSLPRRHSRRSRSLAVEPAACGATRAGFRALLKVCS